MFPENFSLQFHFLPFSVSLSFAFFSLFRFSVSLLSFHAREKQQLNVLLVTSGGWYTWRLAPKSKYIECIMKMIKHEAGWKGPYLDENIFIAICCGVLCCGGGSCRPQLMQHHQRKCWSKHCVKFRHMLGLSIYEQRTRRQRAWCCARLVPM